PPVPGPAVAAVGAVPVPGAAYLPADSLRPSAALDEPFEPERTPLDSRLGNGGRYLQRAPRIAAEPPTPARPRGLY
ncbi:MAG TPA: hypothetical protein VFG43_07350, partial [Geminicoccaceae bacterium]|nr:hypothetical protein [Geminicoccaceae bacterium]